MKTSARVAIGLGARWLNPLSLLERPQALVNFNPLTPDRILFFYCRNNLLDQWTYMKMMTHFRDQKSEILHERVTTQSHSGIKEGSLLSSDTACPHFLIRPPMVLVHPAVFEQFEH